LPDETQLQNIVDEIAELIDSTLYKLKTFKWIAKSDKERYYG
jgi:hypothetical protein